MTESVIVILIGPINAGKTSVARCLAERLGVPHIELDDLRWDYYKEIGYDQAEAKRRVDAGGFWKLYEYWKPFEAHAAARVLSEHSSGVISFGAGHSVYEDDDLFQRVQRALSPFPNVVLLVPTDDVDEALRILTERGGPGPDMQPNINEHFLRHPSNRTLARHVVYTAGRTLDETCAEVLALVRA